jgi:hypothetical protein
MSNERTYPEGVPCRVDTEQPDVDGARHFYATLFGWTFSDAVPADAPGTYLIASLDGAVVAAIGPPQGDAPVEWNTYIAVVTPMLRRHPFPLPVAASRSNRSTRGRADGWRPVSIHGVHDSACGSRGGGWAPK